MTQSSTNTVPRRGATAGFLAGYALLLALGATWFLTAAPGSGVSHARDAVEVAVVPAGSVPLTAAALGGNAASGTLTGQITFDGPAPDPKVIVKKGDPAVKDAAVCAAADMYSEELLVNKDNKGIANVFVYLAKAPAGAEFPKPSEEPPIVFDQKGCQFLPHALLVQVGQKVLVKSGDPIVHNTHTNPLRNKGFNQAIKTNERDGVELKYTVAENLPIPVVCDFHPWMKARHLILDHPYMALTDADGKFKIDNLPEGKHEFRIWHEIDGGLYLDRKYEVQIKAGESKDVKISYKPSKFKL